MKWFQSVLIFTAASFATEGFAQDLSSREQNLYDIYQQYHSQPTDSATWERLTSPLVSETYKIQNGDNLWTISEILFGDGNYWPKVWSINSRITNPHLIEPGNEIRFRLGTAESQPSFFISEGSQSQDEVEVKPYLLSAESSSKSFSTRAMIPPPSFVPKPVLKTIPRSLDRESGDVGVPTKDNWGLEIVRRPRLRALDKTYLQSYVQEGPIDFVGEVVERLEEDELLVEGQVSYLKLKSGLGAVGERYLIVQDEGAIDLKALKIDHRDKPKGHVIRVAAEVELQEMVTPERPQEGFTYFRARLVKSLDLVQPGFKILAQRIRLIDHDIQGRMTDQSVAVIGGHLTNHSNLFSTGNFIFLDKGSSSGLSTGDIIPIHKTKLTKFRMPVPMFPHSPMVSGNIQIVDVQNQYATAIVLTNSDDIRSGDGSRGRYR